MKFNHYRSLLSEMKSLEILLQEIPEDDVLDRFGIEARVSEISHQLQQSAGEIEMRNRAKTVLTFTGRPVVGTHGIFAEFGMKAVNSFSDAVAAVAASLAGPLRAMGPIPNREQNQLLITNTATGSFGFELEEHGSASLLPDEPTAVEQALEKVQDLLTATVTGDDEKLADTADELDRRAIDKVRDFVKTLAENEAMCTLKFGMKKFAFTDLSLVQKSLERISNDNLIEFDENFGGTFLGVLPNRRTFEFQVYDGAIIGGKIGNDIRDPFSLNQIIGKRVRISVSVTKVNNGAPRYVVRGIHDVI